MAARSAVSGFSRTGCFLEVHGGVRLAIEFGDGASCGRLPITVTRPQFPFSSSASRHTSRRPGNSPLAAPASLRLGPARAGRDEASETAAERSTGFGAARRNRIRAAGLPATPRAAIACPADFVVPAQALSATICRTHWLARRGLRPRRRRRRSARSPERPAMRSAQARASDRRAHSARFPKLHRWLTQCRSPRRR